MSVKQSRADSKVREHFTRSTELYVDRYEASYLVLCRQRMDLLNRCWRPNPAQPISVLDVGCGAGIFADHILETFPAATICCVDVSIGMLRRGKQDSRKRLILGDARNLPFAETASFDLINADALMHHLVTIGGYESSIDAICAFLAQLRRLLKPNGLLLVREIYHEHVFQRELGSRLLYAVSTTRTPAPVARFLRKAGLNTANIGVCFLVRNRWREVLSKAGFSIVADEDKPWGRWLMTYFGFICGDIYVVASSIPNGFVS